MSTNAISERDFLLTELRYTLGQLHVQLGDLSSSSISPSAAETDRTVEQVVASMIEDEGKYQAQYARLLHLATPAGQGAAEGEEGFRHARQQTLTMLEQAGDSWSQELIACVQQHVANDRTHTTVIADMRKGLFEHDQRPDLHEPLA